MCPESLFASKLENWLYSDQKDDQELAKELAVTCREAWNGGVEESRYAVLTFILRSDRAEFFDLVAEALSDDSVGLASHAAAVASSLVARHTAFGLAIRDALRKFGQRVPSRRNISDYALDVIDNYEQENRSQVRE
jgi:hypothetical protein